MKLYLIILWFVIIMLSVRAQDNFFVKITVHNEKKEPLFGAHIQLLCDNNKYNAITDENGIAKFNNVKKCKYKTKISFIGYNNIDTVIIVDKDKSMIFYLKEKSITLKEVEVTAPKPIIKQEEEKTIINPEPVASVSSNTMEVLESVPGIYIDPDGYIYVAGTRPATIYINGIEQKLSADEITVILRNLPPDAIEKIEIIRTPSAKYDAATTGGIVNIVLKKGVIIGQYGTVSLGANQGIMGNRLAGLSYSNQTSSKFSFYSNISHNNNEKFEEIFYERYLLNNVKFNNTSELRNKSEAINLNSNITYYMDTSKTISYDLRFMYSNFKNVNSSFADVYSSGINTLNTESNSEGLMPSLTISNDVAFNYKLDTSGSKVEIKTGYMLYLKKGDQDYENIINIPVVTEIMGESQTNTKTNNYYLITDVVRKLQLGLKLEGGLKLSFVNLDSKNDFFSILQNNIITDTNKTAYFKYFENICAFYCQLSKELLWGIFVKPGIRIEYTYTNGKHYYPRSTEFNVDRTDFFPYLYIGRKIFQFKDFELHTYLIYRKSITRPDYKIINPAITYIDNYNYQQGNPQLKPQFNENYEFNISYKEYPVFAIGKSYTKNIFSEVTYSDTLNSYRIIRTYDNLGKAEQIYLKGMVGIPPGGLYFFGIGFQYSKDYYNGYYQNLPFIYKKDGWRFFTFHQLKLLKHTKLTLSGFWLIGGMWNFYELKNFGQINTGINQNLFKNKLTINIYLRDIFNTNKNEFKLIVGDINASGERKSDSQRVGVNIKYNFGINKGKDRNKFFNDFENTEEQY